MSHQPKVLMYGWELPPNHSGGLGEACYGLTQGLSQLGAKVTFVLPRKLPVNIQFMDVKFDTLPVVDAIAVNSLLKAYLTEWGYQKMIEGDSRSIDLKVHGTNIYDEAVRFGHLAGGWATHIPHDVIHVHDWLTFPAGITASFTSRKPLIAHVHATEYDRAGNNGDSRIMQIENDGVKMASRVICVSELTKNMVVTKYGVDKNKIDVVYNGVNSSEIPDVKTDDLLPNKKIILYLGRLTYQKGVEYFLRAAKRIADHRDDVIFVIVGSGDLEKQLIMQSALLGLGNKIIFTGWIKDSIKKAKLLRRSDVFVMPSISEPFGLVALEALAVGKPIVVSRQSGVAEVLNHCIKVNFWDTDELANKIVNLLRHPELSQLLIENGSKEMEQLTWHKAAQQTMNVYHKFMHR